MILSFFLDQLYATRYAYPRSALVSPHPDPYFSGRSAKFRMATKTAGYIYLFLIAIILLVRFAALDGEQA